MKVLVYSTRPSTRETFDSANQRHHHELVYTEARLAPDTAALAKGYPAVCLVGNDIADAPALDRLAGEGVQLIALRAAGFNNVDLPHAMDLGLKVVRVPAYSPHAVAEHAIALILTLNRKIHRAYARVREGNFSLEGLMGFDMDTKTVGIIGTGKIGAIAAGILKGFGCRIIVSDPYKNAEVAKFADYMTVPELLAEADIVSLHCPLTPESHHLIDAGTLADMKKGSMLINTSRGGLVDARACIESLKIGHLGSLGLDVYEEEEDLFFEDLSDQILQDDLFARLLTFPNVLITAHQAFFTKTAMDNIAETTLKNLDDAAGNSYPNAVGSESIRLKK
ncbi:MAG: 2-hydroxyacid dehydrogenase [Planctomycetaceae bacterium]|nr:2-hydroxyacid dehydrogenase [Planctomycetaceae bacterium]